MCYEDFLKSVFCWSRAADQQIRCRCRSLKVDVGKEVGDYVATAANEDEVVRMGIGDSGLEGLRNGGISVAVELMVASQFCNALCRNGSVCGSLCKIVAGVLGQHGENGVDVLVVDHSEDDAQLLARLRRDLWSKVLPGSRVVARVANDERLLVECLPTAHQSRVSADVRERLWNDGDNVFDVVLFYFF